MICRIRQAKEYRGKTSIYDALNAEAIGDDDATLNVSEELNEEAMVTVHQEMAPIEPSISTSEFYQRIYDEDQLVNKRRKKKDTKWSSNK